MGQKLSDLKVFSKQNKIEIMEDNRKCNNSGENLYDSINVVVDVHADVNGDVDEVNQQNCNEIERLQNVYTSPSDVISDTVQKNKIDALLLEYNANYTLKNEPCANHVGINKPFKCKLRKKRSQKSSLPIKESTNKKKKNPWGLKFNCARIRSGNSSGNSSEFEVASKVDESDSCVCTGYRKTESPQVCTRTDDCAASHAAPNIGDSRCDDIENGSDAPSSSLQNVEPVIDLSKFNPDDYPIEDLDERARLERAREIAEGVDPPPGFSPKQEVEIVCNPANLSIDNLAALFRSALSLSALSQIEAPRSVHSQIDYIHCLVPDLFQITSCSFYWGKMDRYEAERLLENKPEGTFLLRDSAQEEYLFSVSFRKYGRSLHARIEQWNHKFSFDSHDPGVFASTTVCGLIEHYKDPTCCMFFEPMLTIPLHRNFPFSLQHLCRAVICDNVKYDGINYLKLPRTLKSYLKEYHYKQRDFEDNIEGFVFCKSEYGSIELNLDTLKSTISQKV